MQFLQQLPVHTLLSSISYGAIYWPLTLLILSRITTFETEINTPHFRSAAHQSQLSHDVFNAYLCSALSKAGVQHVKWCVPLKKYNTRVSCQTFGIKRKVGYITQLQLNSVSRIECMKFGDKVHCYVNLVRITLSFTARRFFKTCSQISICLSDDVA